MAAHLYWRLNISATNGSVGAIVTELAMYVAGGASSATTGGTASASSTSAGSASNAFDNSTSTSWQSGTTLPVQLQYQFASAVDITSYALTGNSNTSNVPNSWTLEYSDDGSSWTVADTVTKQKAWVGTSDVRYYTVGANAGQTATGKQLNPSGPLGRQTTPAAGNQVQIGKAPPTAARTVSGTVSVLGTLTGGLLLRAYAKATGEFLGSATSAPGTGAYTINCGPYFGDVEVIAFNPTTYQALIYDQVAPG
jgi:hypothetical protein